MSNVNTALIDNMSPFFLKRREKITAALAYQSLPLLTPKLVAVWGMNENTDSLMWDSSSQGRHMTINGTAPVNTHGEFVRLMELTGSGYLSRASEAAFETGGSFSVYAWIRKNTAATQFPILCKTIAFTGSTNSSFYFVYGSGDQVNLSIIDGTTTTTTINSGVDHIGEIIFVGASYDPGNKVSVYLGSKSNGLVITENTTSIPASRNAASSTTMTIAATDGGSNQASGAYGKVVYCNAVLSQTFFRTYFEYTKALFF